MCIEKIFQTFSIESTRQSREKLSPLKIKSLGCEYFLCATPFIPLNLSNFFQEGYNCEGAANLKQLLTMCEYK